MQVLVVEEKRSAAVAYLDIYPISTTISGSPERGFKIA
jgi:hypothetical protein